MKHSIKNITVNGINYYLVGNCYMPTAPGLVPDRRTGIYGMIHLKYLQMAHPDDVVELIASGRIRQYYVSELTLSAPSKGNVTSWWK